jgi:ABC-type branched-subunit amino acid transport system ATPase component/ABC-type branched-subunit amino acid transport system permease subunit
VIDFEAPVEVVVLGLITGLTYALLGVGLVLVYKTSRVLNFAHGEMGALAANVIPALVVVRGLNYWVALPVALITAAAAGALTELLVIRRLARAPRLIVLVATIGASQLFFAIGAIVLSPDSVGGQAFPTPFASSLTIGDLRLNTSHFMIMVAVPMITVALALFFRFTKMGVATRAAAENADAAELAGVHTRRVSLAMWTIAGVLAGISAILSGPSRPLVSQVAIGPSLMVRALAAAMIGGLDSIPRVFVAGVAIGLVEALVSWNYPTGGTLEVVLLVLILASLLARRGLGALARGGEGTSWSLAGSIRTLAPAIARHPRVRLARVIAVSAALVVAILLPVPFDNSQQVLLTSMLLFALMGMSLVVLTGYAGQISLGQFAFVALGALVGGRTNQLGYDPWMCIVYALVAGSIAALLVGLPALRIRGLFLAVTTLAFAVAGQIWFYGQSWLVRVVNAESSLEIPRPRWLGIDFQPERNYYWLCLAVLVVVAAIVHHLARTGVGRSMMAVRENEPAAAAMAVPPRRVKLTAFVLAGMIASLAGYFYGGLLVSFQAPTNFAAELSLALVAMVILGGVTTVTGALIGAVWVRGLARIVSPFVPELEASVVALLVSGPGLLFVLLAFPGGLGEAVFALRDRVVRRLVGTTEVERPAPVSPTLRLRAAPDRLAVHDVTHQTEAQREGADQGFALEADDVVVRFGGNVAVDHVSIRADNEEIVGLVGPNGAGKTTLFNVLSGQLRPERGRVLLGGADITSMRPEQRARLGLGRTFQQGRIFGEMTVLDSIKVSLEREDPSEVLPSVLALPPSWQAEARKDVRANELAELFGVERYTHFKVAELSTGTRRLVELACTVGLGARVLLLDEPTAGIAQREVEAFRPVFRQVRDHLGATMVIIEHDIPMITSLVDRLYVLASGAVIAEGPPSVIRENAQVVAAYLGTDERAIQKSGTLAR